MKNLFSRMRSTKIRAVYDEDLMPMLEKAGLLCRIENGEIMCKYSNEVITLENLAGIIPTPIGYDLVSNTAFRNDLIRTRT